MVLSVLLFNEATESEECILLLLVYTDGPNVFCYFDILVPTEGPKFEESHFLCFQEASCVACVIYFLVRRVFQAFLSCSSILYVAVVVVVVMVAIVVVALIVRAVTYVCVFV